MSRESIQKMIGVMLISPRALNYARTHVETFLDRYDLTDEERLAAIGAIGSATNPSFGFTHLQQVSSLAASLVSKFPDLKRS